ncbi:MAG: sterol desaturase family protein [Sandaracinaceae bacterium]|nr:sterol desaturase family protein [Sandaracinaceae bacterium]
MQLPSNQPTPLRRFVSRTGYAGALLLALGTLWLGQRLGLEAPQATLLAVVWVGALLLFVEQRMPHTPDWRPSWGTLGIDVLHNAMTAFAVAPLVRAVIFALLVDVGARLAGAVGVGLWPSTWPVALQLVLALVISDFGAYSAHRFMHLTRFGWRLHAVHHTPAQLHVLASARTHPLNAVLTLTCETGPLILLGISPAALAAWTVFKAVNGLLQHANIDLRPGWLSYVVATSDVHRYHHSVHLHESNTNFGNTTMLWDHVFRTFHLPRGEQAGTVVGIADAAVPESYLAHLAVPFRLGRYEALAVTPQPSTDGPHASAHAQRA